MENEVIVCKKCGEKFTVDTTSLEEKEVVCPKCGATMRVFNAGNRSISYVISNGLYMAAENDAIPVKKKKTLSYRLTNLANSYLRIPKRKRVAFFLSVAIVAAIGFLIWHFTRPLPVEETMAFQNKEEIWQEYRDKNPFNFQSIGIKKCEDGSYVVILSEPSDRLMPEQIEKFFSKYHSIVSYSEKKLGYDGWLKDVVVALNGLRDYHFNSFVSRLNNLFYGTKYKPYYIDLNSIPKHTDFSAQNINYQISAEEIRSWFIENKESLISVDGRTKGCLSDCMEKDGLYYSESPGFVVWIINTEDLSEKKFRDISYRFSVDSDLIFGAVKKNNHVAIIARERSIPVTEMTPMRTEIMLMLATTDKDELSQSYERNNVFAGKLPGGKDYAPILLSEELWHTEYGSILNITDQMLKSWSENGKVEYEEFIYPQPVDWAFEDGAVVELGVLELTYNWNTSGAGYEIEPTKECPVQIYAVNRTGSLPVSYIPGDTDSISENDQIYLFEEKAYDFFSNLNSPELCKVVQYASFYQICHNLGVKVDLDSDPVYYDVTTCSLEHEMESLLNSIRRYDATVSDKIDDYYDLSAEQLAEFGDMALPVLFYQLGQANRFKQNLDSVQSILNDVERYGGIRGSVAEYVVNPRDIEYERLMLLANNPNWANNSDYAMYFAFLLSNYIEDIKQYNSIFEICPLTKAKELYLDENSFSSSHWIKCPTIVQSWSERDSTVWQGGHNLNSKITPIEIDNTLKPGEFKIQKIDGKKKIFVSSVDRGKITPSFLRKVERTGVSGINKFKSTVKAAPVRDRATVMSATEKRSGRGFNTSDHVPVLEKTSSAFILDGKEIKTVDELMSSLGDLLSQQGNLREIKCVRVSENEVKCIMEGSNEILLRRSGQKLNLNDFDIDNIQYDISKSADDITIVRIPSKPESFVSEAGFGGGRIKSMDLEFEVPTSLLGRFIQALKTMFNEAKGYFDYFRLHRIMKTNDIDPSVVREIQNYQIAFIRNYRDKLEIISIA